MRSSPKSRLVVLGGVALATFACGEPPRATLVGLPGCGLELPEYSAVRWVARGDFPQGGAQDEVEDGVQTLPELPEGTSAITVEVLSGDLVEAVGRTARLENEGEVPVYFAPPDALCVIMSAIAPREVGAIAVDPHGDVVVVGGRGQDGGLLDEVVHLRDVDNVALQLEQGLAIPSTGHSVHPIGERRFAVVGGTIATANARLVRIDFEGGIGGDHVEDSERIDVSGDSDPPRAHHAAATMPDGRILIAGGCSGFDELTGQCVPMPGCVPSDAMACPILSSAFWIEPEGDELAYQAAPPLATPRYGADLVVARDGVAFVVGGHDMAGAPLRSIERLRPGGGWKPYGPPPPWWRWPIVGATVLEGGLVVVALANGEIGWVSEHERGLLEGWCEPDGPCFDRADPPLAVARRPLLALPGERVLADAWLLPVGLVGRPVEPGDSLSVRPDALTPPPGQRVGAAMTMLADGSVLLAGGRDPSTNELTAPFFLRLRPQLDGPDEEIPDVANLVDAFVASIPSRARIEDAALVVDAAPAIEGDGQPQIPRSRVHVRGLRSSSLHFDVELAYDEEGPMPVPHLWLSQGAVAGASVRFEEDATVFARLDASGELQEVACDGILVFDTEPRLFKLDVRTDGIDIVQGSNAVRCPGPGDSPFAIGLGVSGEGSISASGMRLSRIDG